MLSVLLQRCMKKVLKLSAGLSSKLPVIFPRDRLYFAYGANINPEYLKDSGVFGDDLGVFRLDGFRIGFDMPCEYSGVGYASVVREEMAQVWGALYRVDTISLWLMDVMEWVPFGAYRRESVRVKSVPDSEQFFSIYVSAHPRDGLKPPSEYLHWILESGEQRGFPDEYLEQLRKTPVIDDFVLDHDFELLFQGRPRLFKSVLAPIYRKTDVLREWVAEVL